MPHETEYNFTELKNKRNLRTIHRVIGRHIYLNKNKIKKHDTLDLMFKVPFRLAAKRLGDTGFWGSDGTKTGCFLIKGIRLVKKKNCHFHLGSGFAEEEYYFPEKHPERYLLK